MKKIIVSISLMFCLFQIASGMDKLNLSSSSMTLNEFILVGKDGDQISLSLDVAQSVPLLAEKIQENTFSLVIAHAGKKDLQVIDICARLRKGLEENPAIYGNKNRDLLEGIARGMSLSDLARTTVIFSDLYGKKDGPLTLGWETGWIQQFEQDRDLGQGHIEEFIDRTEIVNAIMVFQQTGKSLILPEESPATREPITVDQSDLQSIFISQQQLKKFQAKVQSEKDNKSLLQPNNGWSDKLFDAMPLFAQKKLALLSAYMPRYSIVFMPISIVASMYVLYKIKKG